MDGTIFGMPKKAALIVGAGALGVVGYAYWKNSSGGSAAAVVDPSADIGATDYESPLGNTGTNSTGSTNSTDPDAIDTNAKWTQAATDALEGSGWERSAVVMALGKWLSFEGLTPAEHTIVVAAKGVQGDPPVGGPYPLKDALPSTPSTGGTGGTTTPGPDPSMPYPTGQRLTKIGKNGVTMTWGTVGRPTFLIVYNGNRGVPLPGGTHSYTWKNLQHGGHRFGLAYVRGTKTGPRHDINVTI